MLPVLGTHTWAPLWVYTSTFVDNFASEKIAQWCKEIRRLLSAIALTQPHAAYAAFTHGLSSKWSYHSRRTPGLSSHLENIIRSDFIPALTGNPAPDDLNREIFALPAREGGLGLITMCDPEYISSRAISEPLVEAILQQSEYSYSCFTDQVAAKISHSRPKESSNRTCSRVFKECSASRKKKSYGISKRERSIKLANHPSN